MNNHRCEQAKRGPITRIAGFCIAALAMVLVEPVASAQTVPEPTMSSPIRITESPQGLMVGDYVGYSVVFLDPSTLAVTDTITVTGKPLGVAWMNGRVYVGDERSGNIEIYEKTSSGMKNTKNQKNSKKVDGWVQVSASLTGASLERPSDIAVDEELGLLFVASRLGKMVQVLDETGALIRTIGAADSTNPVGRPQGLALDRAGQRIFVSDDGAEECTWMGCAPASLVHVYDYNGNFLGAISGNSGQAGYEFSRIQGVTVDSTGRVYLVDSYRGQVLVFDEVSTNSWTGIGTFGSKGAGVKELLLPMDVIVDEATSTIYATNTMKGRVEVFTMADMVQ